MNISMDGLRKNMVRAFDQFASADILESLNEQKKKDLSDLASLINVLCCIYDENDGQFNDLSEIKCKIIFNEELEEK